jgi:hypothetical protein
MVLFCYISINLESSGKMNMADKAVELLESVIADYE